MARKNALGRGLGALIDEEDKELLIGKISGGTEIFIDRIELNPFQPRSKIDEESLNELASSIKELGIVVPITVREIEDNKYQLITGERRLRAAKIAGIKKIPAFVRIANDQNMLEMALVENIQREDLNAIDVAISYQRLTEECNLTQEDLSQRVGKKRATVTNYLRLLKLPPEIQLGLKDNKISMGHARALINIEDTNDQLRLYYKIVDEDLSVRKVEELARKINKLKDKPEDQKSKTYGQPKEYDDLKVHLSEFFKTNIDFKRNNKGAGKIVISFNSDEELERIIAIFDSLKMK
jgi:ParB family chromosome partitioning protein